MINVRVFDGAAYRAEKRNIRRGETFALPKDALFLASDIVMDGEESVVEVWWGVPFEPEATATTPPDKSATFTLGAKPVSVNEEWPFGNEDDCQVTVEYPDE